MLSLPSNEEIRSINPVVGETNDGWLNDIRGQHITGKEVRMALGSAVTGPVPEGCVGAGAGTRCLGFKGGIGTSSRLVPMANGTFTVGVLVQTNFGGDLTINGAPVGSVLGEDRQAGEGDRDRDDPARDVAHRDGSCMIVIATDAPLSDRNLERLATRSFLALGKVGSVMSNGSGDYAIAFSTHPGCRIPHGSTDPVRTIPDLANDLMSPLFQAVVEATEESIYNSLFMAEDMEGYRGRKVEALPLPRALEILDRYGARTVPAGDH
jgi:D-aminopeptidase